MLWKRGCVLGLQLCGLGLGGCGLGLGFGGCGLVNLTALNRGPSVLSWQPNFKNKNKNCTVLVTYRNRKS